MNEQKILADLVSFNTAKDLQNAKIIAYLQKVIKPFVWHSWIIKTKDNKKALVVSSKQDLTNCLIFSGHTDTVPAGQGWKTNPWQLRKVGNKLFGLGSADMKGSISAMISAVAKVDLKKLRKGVGWIFTFDEEVGFGGVKAVMERLKLKNNLIVIGEPTELRPVVASKGVAYYKIEFIGESCHASTPDKGVNAILLAQDFILRWQNIFGKAISKKKSTVFEIPRATLNFGKIFGGDASNKVPDFCSLSFEMRVLNEKQSRQIDLRLKRLIRSYGERAKIVESNFLSPFFCQNEKIIKFFENVSGKKTAGVNYATEAPFYAGQNDVVIFGPGSIKQAHQPNEYIEQEQLARACQLYRKLIEKFCR